jgi:hypothetical protein
MSSVAARVYKIANVMNMRGGYQKLFIVTTPIFYHRYGHYVRPNRVAFMYSDFKKDGDPYACGKMFNFVVQANVETFEDYIINAFSYTQKDTSDWCHNYMS